MQGAVALFFAMATQWNYVGAGMAGAFRVGMKYEVLPAIAPTINVTFDAAAFRDIRVMEAEALKTWSRK